LRISLWGCLLLLGIGRPETRRSRLSFQLGAYLEGFTRHKMFLCPLFGFLGEPSAARDNKRSNIENRLPPVFAFDNSLE
jgi:hypothetical protein